LLIAVTKFNHNRPTLAFYTF